MQRKVKRPDTKDDSRFKIVGYSVTREQGWSEPQRGYHVGVAPKLQGGRCVTSTGSQTVQRLKVVKGSDPNATRIRDGRSGHTILIFLAEHCVSMFLGRKFYRTGQFSFCTNPQVNGREDLV